jgi:hypothetical protein
MRISYLAPRDVARRLRSPVSRITQLDREGKLPAVRDSSNRCLGVGSSPPHQPVLSTNVSLRLDGRPRSDENPTDPGVAIHFSFNDHFGRNWITGPC